MLGLAVKPQLQLLSREKKNLTKKIQVSKEVQQISLLMGDPSVTPEQVAKAGVLAYL